MERGILWLLCLLGLLCAPCIGSARGLFLFGQPEFAAASSSSSSSSSSSYKRSNCKPIPASLLLCRGIEYPNMRLPNLLGHETLQEVLEQAGAWIPLVQKQCHRDTRKFLCSLFAPVCIDDLDETIQPCHSLCQQVKESCAPVMSAFGFPWPDMLDCGRFPQDNDLCIPPASGDHVLPTPREVCEACKSKNEDDNEIVENLCRNDFALKIKVKEIAYINGDTKITPETKSKTIYKLNGVTERDLKKTVLWLKGGLQCTCDEMNDINAPYLVMGQRLAGELVITSVKRWQKGQRAFKRFSRSIRKLQC
nr:PREDICTED: secreted frizzled-related protein 2 isoform X2 [Anolis carolinensis]|eukprot:XP_016849571.1 PREDICTED: secreted frizzled-related protein 2 isoform X2 [Anolis carolinensis]